MTDTDITTQSRDSRETGQDAIKDLGTEARNTAEDLKSRAAEEVAKQGQAAKSAAADEISNMGDALRRASDELRDGSPQERTFGQLAGALADLSDTVRDKDFGEMAGDLSNFARRNPLAFLGGAALLGFAGTRVARASERNRHKSVDLADMWGSDADDDALDDGIVRSPAVNTTGAARPQTTTPASAPATSPAAPAVSRTGEIK